jgi:hypothetical protein
MLKPFAGLAVGAFGFRFCLCWRLCHPSHLSASVRSVGEDTREIRRSKGSVSPRAMGYSGRR